MSDMRKKGCPNERCIQFFNKVKNSSDINYCPKCGTKLIYVCSKCFCEIEDIDPKYRLCQKCKMEADEKREQAIKKTKDIALELVVAPLAMVAKKIILVVTKDAQKIAEEKGTKAAKKVFKILLKR